VPSTDPDPSSTKAPLIALLTANLISQTGNILSILAIPWFVLSTTGSATSTSITVAVGALPVIIAGVFGGTIVDRLGYRPASIISDLASGFTTLLIPLLHHTVGIAFWQLLVLVFLGALLDAPGVAARRSLFPDLVELAGVNLERANAAYAVTNRLAAMLGAPLGGVLIAMIGASNLLYVNAASFGVSALIIAARVPAITRHPGISEAHGLRRYLAEIREGFALLHGDRLLFWMVTSFSIGSLLAEPLYAVILQVYVQETYGTAENLGYIFVGLAIGSLVGNLIFATLNHRLSRSGILIGGFALRALAFLVFFFVPPWWVVAAAIFVGAVALEPVNPLYMTILHERVPAGMRGRIFSVAGALGAGTLPLGIVAYGFLLDRVGLESTLAIFAIVNLLVPISMALAPVLRRIQPPEHPHRQRSTEFTAS
jgi:MFS family permease